MPSGTTRRLDSGTRHPARRPRHHEARHCYRRAGPDPPPQPPPPATAIRKDKTYRAARFGPAPVLPISHADRVRPGRGCCDVILITAIAEWLAVSDPSNTVWQRDLSVSLWKLADLPGGGVTWRAVAARLEAMDARGILQPSDRQALAEARRRAAAE